MRDLTGIDLTPAKGNAYSVRPEVKALARRVIAGSPHCRGAADARHLFEALDLMPTGDES